MKKVLLMTALAFSFSIAHAKEIKLPSGSYLETCENCYIDCETERLTCDCKRINKKMNKGTSKKLTECEGKTLSNQDGSLECD